MSDARDRLRHAVGVVSVTCLGCIAILGVTGMILLEYHGRPTPGALIAVVSAAVGALAGIVTTADRPAPPSWPLLPYVQPPSSVRTHGAPPPAPQV